MEITIRELQHTIQSLQQQVTTLEQAVCSNVGLTPQQNMIEMLLQRKESYCVQIMRHNMPFQHLWSNLEGRGGRIKRRTNGGKGIWSREKEIPRHPSRSKVQLNKQTRGICPQNQKKPQYSCKIPRRISNGTLCVVADVDTNDRDARGRNSNETQGFINSHHVQASQNGRISHR